MKRAGIAVIMAALAACATAQDIVVLGGANSLIVDGQAQSDEYAGSNYGPVLVSSPEAAIRMFDIKNIDHDSTLTITSVQVDNPEFFVVQPPAPSIPGGLRSSFRIDFDPSSAGTKTGVVTIVSSDADPGDGVFTFKISGDGVLDSPGDVPDISVSIVGRPKMNGRGEVCGVAKIVNSGASEVSGVSLHILDCLDGPPGHGHYLKELDPIMNVVVVSKIQPGKSKTVRFKMEPYDGFNLGPEKCGSVFVRASAQPDKNHTNNQAWSAY